MLVRALVVLLVVMNLGAAAWWALHRAPPPPVQATTKSGVPPLVLLSEAETQPPADAAELDAAPEPLSATPVCLSLGPLQTKADLRKVMDALTPQVGRIQFREQRATELRGYSVYLPAFADRQQALAAARAMAAKGMRDYYVVTAGREENTVSLGLFRDLVNAEKRRDEARALGYAPMLEPISEDVPNWWVDVAAARGFDWRAALGGYAGVEARQIACF